MITRSVVLFSLTLGLLLASGAALAQDPAERFRQSYALEAESKYEQALAHMEQVHTSDSSDYVSALRVGWLRYLLGRYTDSEAAYREVILLKPAAIEPKLGIMLPLMAQRKWKEAEVMGYKVLDLAPSESIAMGRMAYVQFMLGNFQQALVFYEMVLEQYPSNAEMRAGRAWSLLKLGRNDQAREEFDRVLRFAPDLETAQQGRAQVP